MISSGDSFFYLKGGFLIPRKELPKPKDNEPRKGAKRGSRCNCDADVYFNFVNFLFRGGIFILIYFPLHFYHHISPHGHIHL